MNAWLAPGQGMEQARMGLELASRHAAAELLDLASEVTGRDVSRLLERGGPHMSRTEVVQPALTAVALGAASVLLRAGLSPGVAAGHSAGEISAWSVAGGLTPHDAIRLSAARGAAMAAAGARGGMRALRPAREHLAAALSASGAALAVLNPGDEAVLSGSPDELRALASFPTVAVATRGPWHSPHLATAAPAFAAALEATPSRPLRAPFVSNHTGELTHDVAPHLLAQLTSTVRWAGCLQTMLEMGVTDVILLGPGKHLQRHVRLAMPRARVHRTDDLPSLTATLEALS